MDAYTQRTEPMDRTVPREFLKILLSLALKEGHKASSVAVLPNGTVIGVLLCKDCALEMPPEAIERLDSVAKKDGKNAKWLCALLDDLAADFKKERKSNDELRPGVVMKMTMTAVHSAYKRKGVVSSLAARFLSAGKECGYKYVIAEATNSLSQGLCTKIGFETKKEILYEDWEYGEGSGLFPLEKNAQESGHDRIALMVYTY